MKADQKLTPKYWVVHDTSTDDVYIDTARKSRQDSIEKFADQYGADAWLKDENIEVILVELNQVQL